MKAYKYRFYPTTDQKELLSHTFGCVRFVWNHILDWRSKAYSVRGAEINYNGTSKKLTDIKKEYPFLKNVSSVALQQTLRNQDSAFQNFFTKKSKYPKFKKKLSQQSFRLVSTGFQFKLNQIFIAKSKEPLKIKWHQKLQGKPSSITISKDSSDRYFVSILTDAVSEKLPVTEKTLGIDLGLTHFVITSDGDKVNPTKALRKYEKKLSFNQKKLSKKQKGSNNRNKARLRITKIHAKIADTRKDFLHKLSSKLINENQVICIEDLNVAGMVKNRKLAKAISDASWSTFVGFLEYKAEWYGRTIGQVSPWFPSSQLCHVCGHRGSTKALDVRWWECLECGSQLDRDINAAKNIHTAGVAGIKACGAAAAGVVGHNLQLGMPR